MISNLFKKLTWGYNASKNQITQNQTNETKQTQNINS